LGDWENAPLAQRVLWRCGRRALSDEGRMLLRNTANSMHKEEWRHLFALARVQGMAPLVFHHATQACLLDTMPSEVAGAFRQEFQQSLINNRRMQTVFREVVSAMAADGIDVMALKGLALAHRYYGDFALRPMSDMDLMVRRGDVVGAVKVLRRLGFRAANGMRSPSGFYALTSAVVAYARTGAPTVEAHWELFGRAPYRQALPVSGAWERALSIDLLGQVVRYLHPRDELWYLCVHAAVEHRLERLIWLVDIAELVRSLPTGWDWQAFVHDTITAQLALPVAAALGYCHIALGSALPEGVLGCLGEAGTSPQEQSAYSAAQADLLGEEWIRAAATGLRGPVEKTIFLRGVLLPRRATLGTLYGNDRARWLSIAPTYMRHWRRTLLPIIATLCR
jgi:hypothetical protein